MANLISVNFEGFEIQIDNCGNIYLEDELVEPVNGVVQLKNSEKETNLIVADFFIKNFGEDQLGSFFGIDAEFKLLKELSGYALSSTKKLFLLSSKSEVPVVNGVFEVNEKKKTIKYIIEDLFARYFAKLKEKEVMLGNMLLVSKTLNYKINDLDLLYDGKVAFTVTPFNIYSITDSGFIVIPEGELTHFVLLESVI